MERCIKIEVPVQKSHYCGLMLVGEAPGEKEEKHGAPFIGDAGKLLDSLLEKAGILRVECVVTNVFHVRPPNNKIGQFFTHKVEEAEVGFMGYPYLRNQYLRKGYGDEIERLNSEVETWNPSVIVMLGTIALWAFTGRSYIKENLTKTFTKGGSVLIPCFHPSYLLRVHSKKDESLVVSILKEARRLARVHLD